MRNIVISQHVFNKLCDRHNVDRKEVEQCFENRCGLFLEDEREDHRTDPATLWFIAPTNKDRLLKIVFIFIGGNIHIKTAYEPNQQEESIYATKGR